jgi:putative FmdB family regulatory protein
LPIYEYECTSCGAVTDIRHGFKETTSEVCPTCGGSLKRLFKPAGIVFKGSGFYITDSRKPGDKASKSDSASSSDSAAKSDSGSKGDSGSKSDSGSKGDSGSKPDAAA